jgi:hypothetical protein
MNPSGYQVVHVDAVPALDAREHGAGRWKPLRHRLGVRAFGVNAWTADAGEPVVERHDVAVDCGCEGVAPAGHQELYVFLSGSADFTVGDQTFPVRAGSIVFVEDPARIRAAIAREPGTTVLTVGAAPGQAFAPSEWEERWLRELGADQAGSGMSPSPLNS